MAPLNFGDFYAGRRLEHDGRQWLVLARPSPGRGLVRPADQPAAEPREIEPADFLVLR